MSTTAPTSVIHDIGYKPYTGPRQGRAQIIRALYVHSLRSVFGFGRGVKAKIVPFFVTAVMLFPAVLNDYAASKGQSLPVDYSHMGYRLFLFTVVFVAVAAPELVSRDLRHHTLPLYFSRPLRRSDYPLAKLLALMTGLFIVQFLPVLITYLGQIASANSGHQIWQDTRQAFPGLFVAVLYAVIYSVIGLLLASTTGRRVIATGVIAIFFLVATAVGSVLQNSVGQSWQTHTASCVVPTISAQQAQNYNGPVFGSGPLGPGNGPVPAGGGPGGGGPGDGSGSGGVFTTELCPTVSVKLDNLQNMNLTADPNKPGYADLTMTYQTPVYSMVAKGGGMIDPRIVVEGLRVWVFNATDGDVPSPNPLGPAYGAELAVILVAVGGGLFLRYRKVSVS